MTDKISRVQSILEPIWQEISSLWSGADFAFYEQSLDAEAPEAENPAASDMGRIGQCC